MKRLTCIAFLVLMSARDSLADTPPPPPPDPRVAAANAEKAEAEARKAAYEARKAASDAELAAAKARFEVPSSGYTGTVTTATNAGAIEAFLLSTKAANKAATSIAETISAANPKPASVLVFALPDMPNFQALLTFGANRRIFESVFEAASDKSKALKREYEALYGPLRLAPRSVAEVGLGLDALNKLLGFFRTDYAIGPVEVALEDSLLIPSIAGALRAKAIKVKLPIPYNRAALDAGGSPIIEELKRIEERRRTAVLEATASEQVAAVLTTKIAAEKDPNLKQRHERFLELFKENQARWKGVTSTYDGMFGKLASADDKGVVPIAVVLKEAAIAQALETTGTHLLIVKVHKSGGSYITEKNLWSALGAMPFSVAGGVIVSYMLLHGKDGDVISAGVVPVHGGYHQVNKAGKEFQ